MQNKFILGDLMRFISIFLKKISRLITTLQVKLVFIFVLISIVLMISASVALIYSVETSYYSSFKQRIDSAFEGWGLKDEPSKEEIINFFKGNKKDALIIFGITEYKTISVVNANTNEIIDTNEESTSVDKSNLYNEFLLSKNFMSAIVFEDGDDGNLNYVKNDSNENKAFFDYAVRKGDFILYFRNYREEWQGTLNEFNRIIKYSFIFAIFFSIITGYFLSKAITIPIKKLMVNARKIASGDFEHLLQVNSQDEIGLLTSSFNYMAKQLKNKLFEISSEKKKIETIINNMNDGIIAYNRDGEVIHTNDYAKSILGIKNTFLKFRDFCEKFELNFDNIDYLNSEFNNTQNLNIVLKIKNRIFKIKTAVFIDESKNAEGLMIIFQDVTEEKLLDDMRKEFVANVSHELRTPLTSIKSYTETLMDGVVDDVEMSRKFLDIINNEVDRMTRLVKDLLLLSKVDNRQMKWDMKKVNINKVLTRTIEMFEIEASNNNIKLSKNKNNDFYVLADRGRLEQVFINIISNAIKYTGHSGKVDVNVAKSSKYIIIEIKDTGIGIPEEDQLRIFERFYRVDKARSREMGGTGLGLSIAKDIVEAHGGEIKVDSKIDIGTKIIVMLPSVN